MVERYKRGVGLCWYWEHLIRDEDDYRRHVDYVHVNPLKHDLVRRVRDWPCSAFIAMFGLDCILLTGTGMQACRSLA
jgi:hypothetical protein